MKNDAKWQVGEDGQGAAIDLDDGALLIIRRTEDGVVLDVFDSRQKEINGPVWTHQHYDREMIRGCPFCRDPQCTTDSPKCEFRKGCKPITSKTP